MEECYCKLPVQLRTSWTNLNPGRRFNSCSRYEMIVFYLNLPKTTEGFRYFRWVDPHIYHRCQAIIPSLLSKIENLEEMLTKTEGRCQCCCYFRKILPSCGCFTVGFGCGKSAKNIAETAIQVGKRFYQAGPAAAAPGQLAVTIAGPNVVQATQGAENVQ
ncbi:hypothetical protein M9H77_03892 [Catharanthus roseus]|uniref:Uncharacterized protein n=1 Tax=Catharanthus roseus TaxID=4058 RepID=A0ACC0CCZ2_CATRO|nr:hypothetical protein M9H77_03892 [Catharanthus roseus]